MACLRCHKVGDEGGEVGPNLTHVGKEKPREYLLESIVEPNKQIAKGFETVIAHLTSGKTVAGVLKAEDAATLTLVTPEAQTVVLKKADVEERQRGPSSMPADVMQHLSKAELRDLVEYLAGLK